jgi:hypothetical protein
MLLREHSAERRAGVEGIMPSRIARAARNDGEPKRD